MKSYNFNHNSLWLACKGVLLTGLLGLLTACTPTLNSEKLEAEIQKGIKEQTKTEVKSVSCPKQIKVDKGKKFECTAEAEDGTKATVTVTQEDDKGNVKWNLEPTTAATKSDTDSSDSQDTAPEDSQDSSDAPPSPSSQPADIDPNAPLLDIDVVESTVKEQFTNQAGIPVRAVDCPDKVAIEANGKFDCTVTATDDKTITAMVTQTDDKGAFSWNATKGLISYDKVENLIKNGIQDQEKLAVTPKCGDGTVRFTIAYKGDTFSCTAEDPNGKTIPVNVSVQSDEGQVQVNWNL